MFTPSFQVEVNHIVGAEPNSSDSENCESKQDTNSPLGFNYTLLNDVLLYNQAELKKIAPGSTENATVLAIVDNGIDGYDSSYFPKHIFSFNLNEVGLIEGYDDDSNGYIDDYIGTNISTEKGTPLPYKNYVHGDHGTHVAGIAIGGPNSLKLIPSLFDKFRLKIINIISEIEEGEDRVNKNTTNNARYFTEIQDLDKVIEYAAKYADIVNVSFGYPARMTKSLNVISENIESVLIVAAAGNSALSADYYGIGEYPARYGGKFGSNHKNVISVAAHDNKFKFLNSSTRSKKFVDLAAYGCQLKSYSYGGNIKSYSGTSQAAPLVSFTAALLHSEGITKPYEIKKRIVTSVDHYDTLNDVSYGGALNVLKALEIYRDVITLQNGQTIVGDINFPEHITCDGLDDQVKYIFRRQLRQFIPKNMSQNNNINQNLIYIDVEDNIDTLKCSTTNIPNVIEISVTEKGSLAKEQKLKIPMSQIKDIVLAIRGPYSNS